MAHEYAHALLDRKVSVTKRENSDELIEKRANAFSAAFLMPRLGLEETLAALSKGFPSRRTHVVFDLATGEYTFIPKESVGDTRAGQYLTLIVAVEDDYSLTKTGAAVLYIVPKPEVASPAPNLPPPDLPDVPGPVRL